MRSLLEKLDIQPVNPGACTGPDGWISDPAGTLLTSYNPATGEAIAGVAQATAATYDRVAARAQAAFEAWRTVPARAAAWWCATSARRCAPSASPWANS